MPTRLLLSLAVLLGPLDPASILGAGQPTWAAGPRDALLRYVPGDVGFCLVLQDLRGHAARVLESPFAERFARSPLGKSFLAAPEWKQVAQAEQFLKKGLGVGWAELRDEVLGEAVVLAYRHDPAGGAGSDQGLLLVHARNAKTLAGLVERLERLQKSTGELKRVVPLTHRGVTYYRREERREVNFYCLRGPVLLFTGQEPILKLGLDREQALAADAEP